MIVSVFGHRPAQTLKTSAVSSRKKHQHHVQAIFDWVLALIAEAGLVKGERIGVDASTMEANAALRNIVRRDTGEGYRGMLARLAQESGIETPTAEDLARLDRKRKGKKLSIQDWVSKSDPEAKIAKMSDGTTDLAYKPEHAVDLDTGAVVTAELHPADEGDTTTLEKTLAAAKENLDSLDAAPTAEDPAECLTDKGYHSRGGFADERQGDLMVGWAEMIEGGFDGFAEAAPHRGLESRDRVPDHSWLSRTRARLPHEVHTAIFDWVLALTEGDAGPRAAPRKGKKLSKHSRWTRQTARWLRADYAPDMALHAQTDRRRHPAGGRVWLYLRAYCASWSRSGRSDGPHRLGGWRNRLRRVMFRRRVKPGQ